MTRRQNVTGHRYDAEKRELTVTFHNGRRYRYSDIGPSKAEKFSGAPSRGEFLHDQVIGQHAGRELRYDED